MNWLKQNFFIYAKKQNYYVNSELCNIMKNNKLFFGKFANP